KFEERKIERERDVILR
nr:cytochrome-c reductase 53 kda subunit {P1 peptide} {EC 1.10.2.2.} [Solanum tuberosum=potatoes, Peptide Mitochondrial Partial, 16 aa] [Solanum tuberosum]